MRTTYRQIRGEDEKIDVDTMRYDIAEQEAMNMNTEEVISMLMNGTEGLIFADDQEIIEEWNSLFGKDK
jgi:hypothetical protein